MQIDRLLYPVHSLGPGNRLVIWVRGCKKRCFNCANPELQFFNPKSEISMPIIKDTICEIGEKFDGITITGGEPFCQAKELLDLITFILEITDDILEQLDIFSKSAEDESYSVYKENGELVIY